MTVEELGARMTAREFAEWSVYDAVEGLPDRRAEWQAAVIAAVIANVHRKTGARPYTPADFLPRAPAPAPDPAQAPQRVAGLIAMLEGRAPRREPR
jgi:hypothetical protein